METNQWLKGGVAIAGATNASLGLDNVQVGDSGSYQVRISHTFGSTNSASALLTVNPLPRTPGMLDATFAPRVEPAEGSTFAQVAAIALQSDRKILVGGVFARVNGVPRQNLWRE